MGLLTLDENSIIPSLDSENMGEAIAGCHGQITETLALDNWRPANPRPFNKVLFLGMGGSASGGDFVRAWSENISPVPMIVLRGYDIPKWVDRYTLVIAASYSGNTEETLSAVAQSNEAGAQIAAVTTGGQLGEIAQANGWNIHTMPDGFHPRAAIGYALAALCRVLVGYKMLPASILDELAAGAAIMAAKSAAYADTTSADNPALEIARSLIGKLPVIYGSTGTTEALAVRFRAQLAENSNIFSAHQLLPELNHNEIVGVGDRLASDKDAVVIWLADEADHERVKLRRKLSAELMGIDGEEQSIVISVDGPTLIQRNLALLSLIDWISFYLAIERNVDPSDIAVLLKLKQLMAPSR